MATMRYCLNCGEELGELDREPDGIYSCGRVKCEKEARAAYREIEEQARQAAMDDGFSRYR